MSIKGEIEKTTSYLRSARKAILGRGGEISPTAGLKDFPSAIYNIPADTSLAFITDDAVAYRKVVPENASPYARVDIVGGMSYKTRNLLPFPYNVIGGVGASKVNYGITCRVEEDRSIRFDGTSTTSYTIRFDITTIHLTPGTYNMSVGDYKGSPSTIQVGLYNATNSTALATEVNFGSFTNRKFTVVNEGEISISVHVYKNTEFNNVRFYLMLNEGETALPYEPYFEGIRSAKVTELVSEGVNLFDISKALNDVLVDNGDGTYTITNKGNVNGTDSRFSKKFPMSIPANTSFTSKGVPISGTKASFIIGFADTSLNKSFSIDGYTRTHTYPNDVTYIQIYYPFQHGLGSETFSDFQIEYGTEATEYKPYIGTIATKPIPEALRNFLADKGYGLGVNDTYFNYIDFERKVFVPNVIKLTFDGTENWIYDETYSRIRIFKGIAAGITYTIPCLSNHYDFNANVYIDANRENGIIVGANGVVFVRDNTITNLDDWKAQLATWYAEGNPLTVIYALAEPVEIDISAYLTGDSFIEVQGGGTITAVNEYEYAVPSEINYIQRVGG